MDHDHVKPAILHLERFEKSNVGLMSIDSCGKLITHYDPYQESPYSPYVATKFHKMIRNEIYSQNGKTVQSKITDDFV
jgi:hypothetical protein